MAEFMHGDTIVYYEIQGEGKPIFIIHGWGMDHKIMSGCLEPVFAKKDNLFKRIYIDIPGMGQSKAGREIKTSDDILKILIATIDFLLPKQDFLLIGESYGGYLARGLVRHLFSRVLGLILICPLIYPGNRAGRVVPLTVLEKDDAFLCTLSQEERQSFEYLNVILTKKVWDRFKEDIYGALLSQNSYFLNEVLDGNFSFNVDELNEFFSKPCLILTGKQDTEVGYIDQFELLKNYTGATYIALNRAGHNLQIEQPEMFSKIIDTWLDDNLQEFFI